MDILKILLIISFLIMVIMVTFRLWEIKRNKDFVSMSCRDRADRFIIRKYGKLIFILKKSRSNFANFLEKIPKFIIYLEKKAHLVFSKKFRRVIDMIKGEGINKKKGSASFYLKSISKYKEDSSDR